jgi:uroporphyrinogen-III synthase
VSKASPLRVWVTRSQPGAEATAARLGDSGFAAVVRPVLETQALAIEPPDLTDVDALAFTSGAAVTAFAALTPRRDLPVFAVGDATAERAQAAGFVDVQSAAGDAQALAAAIAAAPRRPRLILHPAALEPAADLVALLDALGVSARGLAVYRTIPTGLTQAPANIDALLIHSPKAARLVAGLVGRATAATLFAYAISPAAAAPLREAGFARLITAARPDEASLLKLLGD